MSRISDRHLRPVDGLLPPSASGKLKLRLRLTSAAASSPAGQMLFIALVNNLCRLTDLVEAIELTGEDVPLSVKVPGGKASTLLAAAAGLVGWAVGDEIDVRHGDCAGRVDLALHIGGFLAGTSDPVVLVGFGEGWRAWVGVADRAPPHIPSGNTNPLGPLMAAAMLAGEVFKRGRGISERGCLLESLGYSLWSGRCTLDWAAAEDGPGLGSEALPPFYLVGAGAVGQALIYCLAQSGLAGSIVVIDDDRLDRTNLNRCFLSGTEDLRASACKVDSLNRFMAGTGWRIDTFPQSLASYVGDFHAGLDERLKQAEAEGRYDIVVSCVDKGNSRQDIQGLAPRLVFGGSTEGLSAKAMSYDIAAGTACLACHNPPARDGERVRILEQQVRGLSRGERARFLADKVAPEHLDEVLDHLDEPQCGSAGESRFRAAALDHGGEFSVSFVSMAAGVLLASAMLRDLLFGQEPDRAMASNFSFLNGRAHDTAIAIDAECLQCGKARAPRPQPT